MYNIYDFGGFMESIKNFIYNKKNLILFYFEITFFQIFLLRILFRESGFFYYRTNLLIMAINTLWVFLIIGHDIRHKKIHYKNKRMFFMLLFLALATIGWIISLPSHGFYVEYLHELVKLYEFGYIFYSYAFEVNIEEIKKTVNILAYSFCAYVLTYSIISFALYISGRTEFTTPNGVVQTMYGNDNPVGHKVRFKGLWTWFTGVGLSCYPAICLHLYLIENGKNKIIHGLCILLYTYLIYLSDTRAALLILAFIVLCYFLFLLTKKYSIKKVLHFGLILGIVVLFALIAIKFIRNQALLNEFLANPIDTIVTLSSGRIQMAIGVIKHLKTTWLFGEGYSNNGFILTNYGNLHPHNVIIAALLYTGIPGTIVFIIFGILNLKKMFTNLDNIIANNIRWLFVLTLCVVIGSMFDVEILGARSPNMATLFFYLCLGICTNTHFKKRD